MEQPKALRLADTLAAGFECDMEWYEIEAAKELRRLFNENEALKEEVKALRLRVLEHTYASR